MALETTTNVSTEDPRLSCRTKLSQMNPKISRINSHEAETETAIQERLCSCHI